MRPFLEIARAALAVLILAALPARAADPIRVDLSLKSPIGADVRAVERPIVTENLAVPGGLQVPGAPLTAGEIPTLPPTTIAETQLAAPAVPNGAAVINVGAANEANPPLSNPEDVIRGRAEGPTVLASLQGLALQPAGELAPTYFDRSKLPITTTYAGDGSAPSDEGPKRPRGVTAIDVNVVHGPADIIRLIPNGVNSDSLKAKLVENVDTMAPYTIYTYHDLRGGSFTGIDLSRNPKLVEVLPEQQSHEVKLIKKIQVLNQDLQVLVRETGKTPDLVVGGVVTELKSLIGDKIDLTYLVNKANNQVHEHAERHNLGNGAVVIDLTAEKSFTPALVNKVFFELNLWRKMPVGYEIPGFYTGARVKKQPITLDKVYLFAGSDLRMFIRHKDGSYRLADPADVPFGLSGDIPGFKKHQIFLRRASLARPPPVDTMLGHAFDQMYLMKELREMVGRGRIKRAFELWKDFEQANAGDAVQRVKNQIRDIWPEIVRGGKKTKDGRKGR